MRPGAAQALALGSELQVRFSDGLVTEEVTSHYFCGRLQTGERLRTERRGGSCRRLALFSNSFCISQNTTYTSFKVVYFFT